MVEKNFSIKQRGQGVKEKDKDRDRDRDRDFDPDMDFGSDMDGDDLDFLDGVYDIDKDRKMFSKKRSCWFCAKKTEPDWKHTSTYTWLVNEFGKISPARVSGLCAGHQRSSKRAIKQGRNIGLLSYLSNRVAQ